MVGTFLLGSGVYGLWISDPSLYWASYLVAAGGLGLGGSLWFGEPAEVSVSIGDSGVAIDDGKQTQRLRWFEIEAIYGSGSRMVVEGNELSLKFFIGANRSACSLLLKEAAERIPDVIDVDPSVAKSLPDPQKVRGQLKNVEDDQLAGSRCAASKELIQLEEDARLCPRCGQSYKKDHVPASCVSCEAPLGERALLA